MLRIVPVLFLAFLPLTVALSLTPAFAQGPGVSMPPLALDDDAYVFDTAEGGRIRVVVVTNDLEHPWSLAFLPGGDMLVTERPGRLRILRNNVLDPQPISGVPETYTAGGGGLLEVTLHPRVLGQQPGLPDLYQGTPGRRSHARARSGKARGDGTG